MRKLLFLFSIFTVFLSCSSDETIVKYTITLSAGEGGTVSTTGGEYESGQTVSVTANPQKQYKFINWSDGNTDVTRTITVLSNITLTANFIKKTPLKIKYEVEYIWNDKLIFPASSSVYNENCNGYYVANGGDEVSLEVLYGIRGSEFSLDSLIIDFRKVTEALHIRITDRVESTGDWRKVPKKIGYIKVIGDLSGKAIHMDFLKAGFQSFFENPNIAGKPPIIYGDSNVDISNLFYNSPDVAGLCTRREKISQEKFNTIFVKGNVSKYYGFILVDYSNSNDRLSIGDKVMNKRIISDFKEYIYD